MVSMGTTLGRFLGAMGVRWTNTDEPDSKRMKAERALKNPVVWYAVNKIAGHIGQLPLDVYRQDGRNINKQTDHFAYQLLRVKPNPYQIPFLFKRTLQSHALLWGNGYAYIRRVGNTPVELIPLRPDCMEVALIDGEKVFLYEVNRNERVSRWEQTEDGETETIPLRNEDVLHIQGLGSDGVRGYSMLSLAADAWEAGNASIRRNLSQIRKGHSGGVVLEVPAGSPLLRDETKAREFLEAWRRDNDGESNAGKTAMLREGITAKVLAMSNRDAEFVAVLKHMRQEEALRFMLESILGDDSSVSYNSLEQKNLAYMQNCLNPWMRTWEEECEVKLLSDADRRSGYYFKFNEGALLRTDKQTTATVISTLIAARAINPNEAREMLDRNPYEGGDEFINPAITQGNQQPEPSSDDPPDDEEEPSAPESRAVQSRIQNLIGVEANRLEQLAEKSKNFLASMDNFYSKNWEPKLANYLEELGINREVASLHCQESKRRLIEVCDYSTAETLRENVAKCVSNWKLRANTIGELQHVQL